MRAAVGFLTVLPIGTAHSGPRRATLLAFPLVGIGIGCVWAGLGWAASQAWDPLVAAALVIAADLALTGALHADAVADVADGVASRKPPDEAIAIMREPQVGAVGAVTATIVVLMRFAFVASLVAAGLWSLLALVPVCGRAAMVVVLGPGDPTRPSLARAFHAAATPAVAGAVVALAAVAAVAAGLLAGPHGALVIALAALAGGLTVAMGFERAWRRRFGTLTGDAAGCAGIAAEVVTLAIVALTPALTG